MSNPPGIPREASRRIDIPRILPHEKVFPIQIGSELFRLSGASISSDAPSYFSSFFQCQLAEQNGDDSAVIRTLYIDRDPVTFGDISRHLQGYHITPRDGPHYVQLFADAQFYQLPRLIDQLYQDCIYISIGGREFQIRKDIFSSPGDSPNFFTLGFAFLFSSSDEVFPGLERDGLLRPPSILAPAIPNRSPDTFTEILHMLRGYPVHIRNAEHRAELLKDCRYFLFKGLEQKLIPHSITHNLFRQRDEITMCLGDIRQSGISVVSDGTYSWVHYSRPYVDERPAELIVEIGPECTEVDAKTLSATFFGEMKSKITRLFEVVGNKMNVAPSQALEPLIPAGSQGSRSANGGSSELSGDSVSINLDDAAVLVDGQRWVSGSDEPARKRRRMDRWKIRTGQWRVRVQNVAGRVECILYGVKLDAVTSEAARNEQMFFLGG